MIRVELWQKGLIELIRNIIIIYIYIYIISCIYYYLRNVTEAVHAKAESHRITNLAVLRNRGRVKPIDNLTVRYRRCPHNGNSSDERTSRRVLRQVGRKYAVTVEGESTAGNCCTAVASCRRDRHFDEQCPGLRWRSAVQGQY